MFESRENTVVGSAILCLALCVCSDVMNKAGMRGTKVYYITKELFLLFTGKEPTKTGCAQISSNLKQRITQFAALILTEQAHEACT